MTMHIKYSLLIFQILGQIPSKTKSMTNCKFFDQLVYIAFLHFHNYQLIHNVLKVTMNPFVV